MGSFLDVHKNCLNLPLVSLARCTGCWKGQFVTMDVGFKAVIMT